MYHDFSPIQKKGLLRKKSTDSLVIDNNILEYAFIKRRGKSCVEMKTDMCSAKNLLQSVKTLVRVRVDLDDLAYAKYNEATKEMMIVGKFTVTYRNVDASQEIVKSYNDGNSCFCFTYNFDNIDKFLEILRGQMRFDACDVPLIPVSL